MKKSILFLCVVLGSTLSLYGSIENEIGINLGATSIENEDGNSFENYGVGVSYQLNRYVVSPRFDLEYVNIADYEGVNSLLKGSVNGIYELETYTNFIPYGLLGLGYEYVSSEVEDQFESHPFVQGGAGVAYKLKEGYKARVEAKMLQIIGGEDENNEMILSMGMSIPIGQQKKRRVVRRRVSAKPIIIRQQVPVYINSRTCPKKIAGPDRDRDGVLDRLDQWPNTPCDFSVDGFGCPVKATLRINFETASSIVRSNSIPKVQNFANFLLRNKGSVVKIIGHTDSVGKSAYNFALSKRRAKAIADMLINLGVSPARVSFDGRGESQPIASNKTEYGKAQNRRIEAILSYPNRGRVR